MPERDPRKESDPTHPVQTLDERLAALLKLVQSGQITAKEYELERPEALDEI